MPAALGPCSRLGIQSAQGIRRGSCDAFAPAAFTHRHDSFRSRRAGRVRRGCRIAGIAAASAGALTLATSAFMFRFVLDTQAPLSMMKLVRAGKVPGTKLEGVRRDAAEEARAARWFERVKEPVEVRSEDGLRLHGWMMPAARGTRENDATGTATGEATGSSVSGGTGSGSAAVDEPGIGDARDIADGDESSGGTGTPGPRVAKPNAVGAAVADADSISANMHATRASVIHERSRSLLPLSPAHRYAIFCHGYTGGPRARAERGPLYRHGMA